MNLPFSTILIILLLFPGFAYRFAYYNLAFSENLINFNPLKEVFFSIIPSLIIHLIGSIYVYNFTEYHVDFDILLNLLNNEKVSESSSIYNNLDNYSKEIIAYNINLILFGFIIGSIFRKTVELLSLDLYFRNLRLDNEWDFVFSGKKYKLERINQRNLIEPDFTILDILSNVGVDDKNIIYRGMLDEYYFSKVGEIDRIVLEHARRFDIKSNSFKEIPGEKFVIPYKNILNLNYKRYKSSVVNKEDFKDKGFQDFLDQNKDFITDFFIRIEEDNVKNNLLVHFSIFSLIKYKILRAVKKFLFIVVNNETNFMDYYKCLDTTFEDNKKIWTILVLSLFYFIIFLVTKIFFNIKIGITIFIILIILSLLIIFFSIKDSVLRRYYGKYLEWVYPRRKYLIKKVLAISNNTTKD